MNYRHILAAAGLLCLAGTAHATIDLTLDNPGVITGPTNLTVQVTVDASSGDTGCWGASVNLLYDATKVTVSSPVADVSGYSLDCDFWDSVTGTETFVSTSGTHEITATTDFITFTVTPVGASADLTDCSVLQMTQGDVTAWPTSELVNQDVNAVAATGSCSSGGSLTEGIGGGEFGLDGDDSPDSSAVEVTSSNNCGIDTAVVTRALKIAAGFIEADSVDVDGLDRTNDGLITLTDVAALIRTPCVSVPRGWYTFQGSPTHTGRTFTAIGRSPSLKWSTDISSFSTSSVTRDIMPSVVAVPDMSTGTPSTRPVVYAVVTDATYSRLYRVQDNGTSVTSDVDDIGKTDLHPTSDPDYLETTGTPLVVQTHGSPPVDSVFITGNSNGVANVYRIDVTHDAMGTHFNQIWHRRWNGHIESSPVFHAGPSYYYSGPDDLDAVYTVNNYQQAIVVSGTAYYVEHGTSYSEGYLFSFDFDTGARVWGYVNNSNGEPMVAYNEDFGGATMGGLYPFAHGDPTKTQSTQSSPVFAGPYIYCNDHSCFVNARRISDGGFRWEDSPTTGVVGGTMSLFNGKLYYGDEGIEAACEKENSTFTGGELVWHAAEDLADPDTGLANMYDSFAIYAEGTKVVFGDDHGRLHGFGADRDPGAPTIPIPAVGWSATYVIPRSSGDYLPVHCSPLIAGTRGGQCTAYIGADDGYVYMLDAGAGTYVGTLGPLNGPIRSSMAAYNGRLYVLAQGDGSTVAPKLYCYGS